MISTLLDIRIRLLSLHAQSRKVSETFFKRSTFRKKVSRKCHPGLCLTLERASVNHRPLALFFRNVDTSQKFWEVLLKDNVPRVSKVRPVMTLSDAPPPGSFFLELEVFQIRSSLSNQAVEPAAFFWSTHIFFSSYRSQFAQINSGTIVARVR